MNEISEYDYEIALANNKDREFFKKHPHRQEYVRRIIYGEFENRFNERQFSHVKVFLLHTGSRMRVPVKQEDLSSIDS